MITYLDPTFGKESKVAWSCDSLQPHGQQPARLLRPWDSPGKYTGVGCNLLLQGIFLTQGPKPGSPAQQADSLLSEIGLFH